MRVHVVCLYLFNLFIIFIKSIQRCSSVDLIMIDSLWLFVRRLVAMIWSFGATLPSCDVIRLWISFVCGGVVARLWFGAAVARLWLGAAGACLWSGAALFVCGHFLEQVSLCIFDFRDLLQDFY